MKLKLPSMFLGLVLILIGVLAFTNGTSFLEGRSPATWMLIFAVISAFFFTAYLIRGFRAWGWLFPACVFAGLSGTMAIVNSDGSSPWIPTFIVGSVAIPFLVAFLLDRSRSWLLLPAFIIGFVALIPLLGTLFSDNALGALVVVMIGLPFIAASILSPKAWWGIIPGGILISVGIMIVLTSLTNSEIPAAVMFIGWMVTFGYLWLRQARTWAKYPAVVAGILASIVFLYSIGLETYWSIGLIVAGLVLVILNLRPRHPAQP